MTDTLLPSAEVVFVAWAKAHTALLALHSGRVGTQLNATRPCLRVQRLGRPQIDRWEDAPELQVEAWATSETSADQLIRTVVAALPDIRGTRTGARISGYEITLGPLYQPDEGTQLHRYLLDLVLYLTPGS
jgi:hypothetical protein